MAKKGRALEALGLATVASAVGGIAGSLFLLLLSPPLAKLSLRFGPAEYFWVAVLGLTLIASLSEGSAMKGMLGGALGMVIGTMGVAPIGGETRFTFGLPVLQGCNNTPRLGLCVAHGKDLSLGNRRCAFYVRPGGNSTRGVVGSRRGRIVCFSCGNGSWGGSA